jgi:hypothetical protein
MKEHCNAMFDMTNIDRIGRVLEDTKIGKVLYLFLCIYEQIMSKIVLLPEWWRGDRNPRIRENIKRDVTRTESGNRKETQNANIKIYTRATYMISIDEYENVYNWNDAST